MFALAPLLAMFSSVSTAVASFNFGAILPWLGGVFGALWASIVKYWQYWLIGFLSLALLFTYHEWQKTATELKTEKAAHAADIAAYKKAQADAQAAADAEKAALTKQSKEQASAADKNYSGLLATYRANLLRYEQAAKGSSSRPGSSKSSTAAQSSDGPSSDTVFPSGSKITITTDDANICATNTARLQAGHDWAVAVTASNKTDENAKP